MSNDRSQWYVKLDTPGKIYSEYCWVDEYVYIDDQGGESTNHAYCRGHQDSAYPLFGPKEYTFAEAFAELGCVVGREVRYEAIPLHVWQERIATTLNPFFAQHIVEVAKDHTAGVFAGTSDVVKQITGKEPMALAEFVQQNKQLFEVDSSAVTEKT